MESPLTRFSATVEDYHRYRPTYPAAFVDWVAETAAISPPARIVDVGCGTGIAARLFAERGYRVTGVDPNADMLEKARAVGGGPEYVVARAEHTGLAAGSFDVATVGQALHWFDLARAIAELERILCPGGWAVAFWNERVNVGVTAAYDELICLHSWEYADQVRRHGSTLDDLRAALGDRATREAGFANDQTMDRDALLGRARSASYVAHGVADLEAFERELTEIWARHQVGGVVQFAYRTVAFAWRSA